MEVRPETGHAFAGLVSGSRQHRAADLPVLVPHQGGPSGRRIGAEGSCGCADCPGGFERAVEKVVVGMDFSDTPTTIPDPRIAGHIAPFAGAGLDCVFAQTIPPDDLGMKYEGFIPVRSDQHACLAA